MEEGGFADGSSASNRKFKVFCKATSTQLSIKLSSCRRQDLGEAAAQGVVAILAPGGGRVGKQCLWNPLESSLLPLSSYLKAVPKDRGRKAERGTCPP